MGLGVRLIEDDSFRATDDGFAIRVRLNWYRSLPLSCVENIKLSLDGAPVAPEALRIGLNGREYALRELAELVEEYWFVQDAVTVRAVAPARVRRGETHIVDTEVTFRAPYIAIGPGRFLTRTDACSASQSAG